MTILEQCEALVLALKEESANEKNVARGGDDGRVCGGDGGRAGGDVGAPAVRRGQ